MDKNQLEGLFFGGIVGDALGVPVEFLDRDTYPKVTDMQEYGTHHQPKGTWSDDTSMTIATMSALVQSTKPEQTMQNFARWIYEAEFTPLGYVFDVGMQTQKVVRNYVHTHQICQQMNDEDEFSNGNGALMRIMPISVLLTNDVEHNLKVMTEFTTLTHPHPRSVLANIIFLLLIMELADGKTVKNAMKDVLVQLNYYIQHDERLEYEFKYYRRLFSDSFFELSLDDICSSGYVVDTLEAAIWILFHSHSYKEAVLMAVNMGDDTDTVAEVTGQLAGLLYGFSQIPHSWLETLQNQPLLNNIANRFMQKFVNE